MRRVETLPSYIILNFPPLRSSFRRLITQVMVLLELSTSALLWICSIQDIIVRVFHIIKDLYTIHQTAPSPSHHCMISVTIMFYSYVIYIIYHYDIKRVNCNQVSLWHILDFYIRLNRFDVTKHNAISSSFSTKSNSYAF